MNIVEQIFDKIGDITAAELSDHARLRKVLQPELNDLRSVSRAFGVTHGDAISADGVTRHYTLDHTFNLILTDRIVDRDNDAAVQSVFNSLYDRADKVLVKIISSKIGLPSIVLSIDEPSFSAPEVLENVAAVLSVSFVVKYRRIIT